MEFLGSNHGDKKTSRNKRHQTIPNISTLTTMHSSVLKIHSYPAKSKHCQTKKCAKVHEEQMTYICLVDWINLSLTNSDQRMWLWRCPHNQYNHHQPRYHNINSSTRFQELYQTRKFWSDKHNLGQKNKKKTGLSPAIVPLDWPLSCFSVCQGSIHVFVICQEWQFYHENGKLTDCTPNIEEKNCLIFPKADHHFFPRVGGPHLFNGHTLQKVVRQNYYAKSWIWTQTKHEVTCAQKGNVHCDLDLWFKVTIIVHDTFSLQEEQLCKVSSQWYH